MVRRVDSVVNRPVMMNLDESNRTMKNWEKSVLLSDGLMKLRGLKPQTERFIGQKASTASSVFPENFEAVKSNFMVTRAGSPKVSQLGEVIDEPTTSRRERLEIYDQDLQLLCQSKVRTKVSLSTGDKKLTAMVENFDSRKGYGFRTSKALESPETYFQVLLLNMEQSRKDSHLGYRNGVVNVANCENLIQENKLYMFAGKNPSHWILRAETFLSSFRDEDKLVIVGAYLEGSASKWFSWEMHKKRITNWSDFKNKLLARFDAPVQVCAPQEVILQHDSIPAINHKSGLSCEIAAIDGVVKTDSFLIHESVNSLNLENDSVQKRYLPSPLQNTVEIQHQPFRQNINLTEEIVSHIIPETEETEVWQNNVNIAEIMLRNDSFLEADQEVEDVVNLDDEFSSMVIVHEAAGAQVADPPVMDETVNFGSSLIHTDCFRDLVSSMEGSSTKSVGIKVTAVKEKAEIPQPKINVTGADLKKQQGRTQFLLLIFKEFGRVQRPWLRSALETQSNSFQLWHRWKNKMGISSLIFINENWVQRLLRETLKQLCNLRRKQGIQTVQQCTLINGEFHVKHKWKSKSEKLLTAKEVGQIQITCCHIVACCYRFRRVQPHESSIGNPSIIFFSTSLRASLFSRGGVYKRVLAGWRVMDVLIWLLSLSSGSELLKINVKRQKEMKELSTRWLLQVLLHPLLKERRATLVMHHMEHYKQIWKKSYKSRMFKYKGIESQLCSKRE